MNSILVDSFFMRIEMFFIKIHIYKENNNTTMIKCSIKLKKAK